MPEFILAFIIIGAAILFLVWKWQVAEGQIEWHRQKSHAMLEAINRRDELIIRLLHECDRHGSDDEILLAEARNLASPTIVDARERLVKGEPL